MKTILIVDDEFGIVDALTDILVEEGFQVIAANNGRVGLQRLKDSAPDLVLLDMMMPVLNGRDMLATMRADTQHDHIAVIMMSAIPVEIAFPSNKSRPAICAYLRKPFSLYELLDIVNGCLDR